MIPIPGESSGAATAANWSLAIIHDTSEFRPNVLPACLAETADACPSDEVKPRERGA